MPDQAPTIPWTHHLSYPDSVYSIAFAPDSQSIYIHQHAPAIDLWPIILHTWPESLGVLLTLLTVNVVVLAIRIVRRPLIRGAPHCRRCRYDLSGQATIKPAAPAGRRSRRFTVAEGTLCPECGIDLARRPPRCGRTLKRRLAPIFAIYLIIAGAYAAMHIAQLPRAGRAVHWLDFSSVHLVALADRYQLDWLSRYQTIGDHIFIVDLQSGQTMRTVMARRNRAHSQTSVSPDGRVLLRPGPGNTFMAISTRTGRRIASVELPARPGSDFVRDLVVIGFHPGPESALVQWHSRDDAQSGVSRWNLRTGSIETMTTTPAYERDLGPWGRTFRAGGEADLRLIALPHFMEAHASGRYIVRIHAPGGDQYRELESAKLPSPSASPALSPCGRKIFLPVNSFGGIVALDLDSGETTDIVAHVMHLNEKIAYSDVLDMLACGMHPDTVALFHAADGRIAARLEHPAKLYAPRPVFSPDGVWLAAICQTGNPATGYEHHLMVWRLQDVISALPVTGP